MKGSVNVSANAAAWLKYNEHIDIKNLLSVINSALASTAPNQAYIDIMANNLMIGFNFEGKEQDLCLLITANSLGSNITFIKFLIDEIKAFEVEL